MSTYFDDFSSYTIGTLPADWTLVGATAEVSVDGLSYESADSYTAANYGGLAVTTVTEVYCQYTTAGFVKYGKGIGAYTGDGTLLDNGGIAAMYGNDSGSPFPASRRSINESYNFRVREDITPIPVAGTVFNTLLQLEGLAVGGASYTAKAWFWIDDETPKTSSDTPDLTYTGTYPHSHTALAGFSVNGGVGILTTLLKFGVGTGGDEAPQSAPSAGASSAIGFNIDDLVFGVEAEAENNVTVNASFNIDDLIFGVIAGSASNVSVSSSFDISDLIFSGSAEATNNSTASVSFDINDLVFGVVAEATNNATSTASFDISDIIFNVNAGSTINTSASIGFDVSDLVISANSSIVTSSTASASFDISDLVFGVVADNQRASGLIDNSLYLVEERLINAFTAGAPALFGGRIKYPNAEFSTPNNLTWAQVFAPASFGPISTDASGCYEINQGQMVVTLFCPRGAGTRLIGAAAHEVKQLFGADNFDDVTITSVVVSPAPEPSSSPWYGINIVINFQYEGHRR